MCLCIHTYIYLYIHTHTYIYIYIYTLNYLFDDCFVYLCVYILDRLGTLVPNGTIPTPPNKHPERHPTLRI